MTQKVYDILTKPKVIRAQIRKAEAEREGLRLSMLPPAIRYDIDKVQTSPQDPFVQYAARFEEIERRIALLQIDYLNAQDDVVSLANKLEEPQSTIITLRFVSGMDFNEISKSIHMSERNMFRHYRKGTEELNKICQ